MMEKTVLKIVFFSIEFLEVFWKDFGLVLGGFWGCFGGLFRNLGILFPTCVNIFDFFMLLERKIAKIYSLRWAGGA